MRDYPNSHPFHEQFELRFQATPHTNQKGSRQMVKRVKSSLKWLSVASKCMRQASLALERLQRRYPTSLALCELAEEARKFADRLRNIRVAIEMNLADDLKDCWDLIHDVEKSEAGV